MINSSQRSRKYFFNFFLLFCCFVVSFSIAKADWNGQPYSAGQTLNPECGPTDENCTVLTPWVSNSATSTYTTSNIGIGTSNPIANLEIHSNSLMNQLTEGDGTISDDGVGNITGNSTHFTTSGLVEGDIILYGGEFGSYSGIVTSIQDDTHLTLNHQPFTPITDSNFVFQHPLVNAADDQGPGNVFTLYGYTASQAIGYNNTVTGFFSTALGTGNAVYQNPNSWGTAQLGIGTLNTVTGAGGIALGTNLVASSTQGIVIGSGVTNNNGYHSVGAPLVNNISNSLMVGFNSDKPTLFVGPSNGASTTGSVGIGTTTPSTTLSVSGAVTFTDGQVQFNPNLNNNGTPGLYAEWWNSQSDQINPDYTITPDATAVVDPSTDLYVTRPNAINPTNINARISGWIKADYSENYQFCSNSDDGSKVWVDGSLVVYNWSPHPAEVRCGNINLQANTWYPYYVEFFQGGGPAQLNITWSSNSLEEQAIPSDHTVNNGKFVGAGSPSSSALTINGVSQTNKFLSFVNSSSTEIAYIGTTTSYFGNKVGIGTQNPTAKLAVEGDHQITFNKQSVFNTSGPNYFNDVFLKNSKIYAAEGPKGLEIFDVKNPSNPVLLGTGGLEGYATRVFVYNNLAFIADENYLVTYDVSDSANPTIIDVSNLGNSITSLYAKNNTLYVSSGSSILVYDISSMSLINQVDPTLLGQTDIGSTLESLKVDGDIAYVVATDGLYTLNVAGIEPGSEGDPQLLGFYAMDYPWDVSVSGNNAYVASVDMSVTSFDISDPANIKKEDSVRLDNRYQDYMGIKTSGDYAYVTDGTPDSVYALYIGDPKKLELAGHYQTNSDSYGLAVDNGYVYVADSNYGLITLSAEENNSVIATFVKGNVGIGTATPVAPLQVAGLGGSDGLKFISNYSGTLGRSETSMIQGNYLYTKNGSNGFDIVDISSPYNPKTVSTYISEGVFTNGPIVSGSYVYISDNANNIEVINVSDPKNPTYATSISSENTLIGKPQVNGQFLYSEDGSNQIEVFDISNPNSPQYVTTISSHENYFGGTMKVFGSELFVTNGYGHVEIFDISTPSSPAFRGVYITDYGTVSDLSVVGNYMYMNDYTYTDKLEVADISDPTNPIFKAVYASKSGGLSGGLAAQGHFVFDVNYDGYIEVIDVTDPTDPKYVTEFTPSDGLNSAFATPLISGKYMYAEDFSGKIETIDISNPKAPVAAVFTGGRVGVGTTDPSAAFSVVGNGGDAPGLVSTYSTVNGSIYTNPFVLGNYAYAIDTTNALEIINVSDPKNPKLISTYRSNTGSLANVFVSGSDVFATNNSGAIEAIDVTDPTNPVLKTTINPMQAEASFGYFFVKNGVLYAPDSNGAFEAIDVHDLNNIAPIQIFESIPLSINYPMNVVGNYAYAVTQVGSIDVINISNSTNFSEVASVSVNNQESFIHDFSVMDNILYVQDGTGGIQLFDVTDPTNPVYRSTYTPPSSEQSYVDPYSPEANGDVFVGSNCSIYTVNVSNINAPQEMDSHISNSACNSGPFISNGYAYSANQNGVIDIFDVTGVAHPSFAATFNNGRVGVGTDNPLAMFDVEGNQILSGTDRYLNFGSTSGYYGYGFRDNNGVLQLKDLNGDWINIATSTSSGSSQWTTSGSDVYYSGGNVGIGTTTPSNALTIDYNKASQTDGGLTLYNSNLGNWPAVITLGNPGEISTISAGNGPAAFVIQTGGSGGVYLSGGGTSWNSNSDERLKTNISDLSSSTTLDKVLALRPVSFNWIDPKMATDTQYGFIAQDVLKLFPELVSVPSDPSKCVSGGDTANNCYGLSYDRFGVLAIAAIKDMASIAGTFRDNIIAWFGDVQNGIRKFYAGEVHTQKICLTKTDGNEVCVTGDQLQNIVGNNSSLGSVNIINQTSSTSDSVSSISDSLSSTTNNILSASSSIIDLTSSSTDINNSQDTSTSSVVEYTNGSGQNTTGTDNTSTSSQTSSSGGTTSIGSSSSGPSNTDTGTTTVSN